MKRLAAILLLTSACSGGPAVVRVYDGHVVEGPFVPHDAYAAYLVGVLAEEKGDTAGALAGYQRALDIDDEDPEVWSRLAALRCAQDPKDPGAERAFQKALAIDGTFAGALAARSRCAVARGDAALAIEQAKRATEADPKNPTVDAALVKALTMRPDDSGRARALALTIAHGESPAAWDALVTWGRAKGDASLVARGLAGSLRAAPASTREVEKGALELLGEGEVALARDVAAAIADAPEALETRGPRDATLARLAVDEALVRGDETTALRRAVRGHVPRAELAARALAWGQKTIAANIANGVAAADPGSSGARMVLTLAAGTTAKAQPVTDRPPALAVLLFAEKIADAAGVEVARAFLAGIAREGGAPYDPLVAPVAVDLAARGVLAPEQLAPALRIELAARRRELPAPINSDNELDARHQLLLRVLTDPMSLATRALATRLAGAVERDPIVGFAVSRIAIARGDGLLGDAAVRRAIASGPADPLLLALAVDLAKRTGKDEVIAPARVRLMAVARTPAERALARE